MGTSPGKASPGPRSRPSWPLRAGGVINRKHLGLRPAAGALGTLGAILACGQANFARMRWKFNKVYNPERAGRGPSPPRPA